MLQAPVDLLGGAFPVALAGQDDRAVSAGLDATGVGLQRLVEVPHRLGVLSLAHGEHGAAVERLGVARVVAQRVVEGRACLVGVAGGDGKPISPGQPRTGRGGQAVGAREAVGERGIGLAMTPQALQGDAAPGGNARVTRAQGQGLVEVGERRGILVSTPAGPARD